MNYLHGVQAFMNSIQGVSLWALRKGFADVGIEDNEFILFSELMDSASLFLTANADTVYFWGNVNLADRPMVMETPPNVLGVIDDFWFRWVGDFGAPGPDRGLGGRYLLVSQGYNGPLPEGGYFVYRSRTSLVTVLGRAFLRDGDPAPAVADIRMNLKLYPYAAGGFGSSIGQYLQGNGPFGPHATPQSPRLMEGSGLEMNTIPPNDFGHFEMLDELVQHEPADALDPELAGLFAAIGIRKGETFAPDARLRAILEEAVATANAASRMLGMGAHPEDRWRYYDEPSAWWNPLFEGGFEFLDPPPNIAADGTVEPYPTLHTRRLNARTSMFYVAGGITPAMCMRLTNIGSQYLAANLDITVSHLTAQKPTGWCCIPASRRGCSGRPPCTTTRPGRCCAPRSGSRGLAARTTRPRLRRPTRTVRRRSTTARSDRKASPTETGCRPTLARVGSSSCGSTRR